MEESIYPAGRCASCSATSFNQLKRQDSGLAGVFSQLQSTRLFRALIQSRCHTPAERFEFVIATVFNCLGRSFTHMTMNPKQQLIAYAMCATMKHPSTSEDGPPAPDPKLAGKRACAPGMPTTKKLCRAFMAVVGL